jgi:hypothetical protein
LIRIITLERMQPNSSAGHAAAFCTTNVHRYQPVMTWRQVMKLAKSAIAGLGLAGSLFCVGPALAAAASQSTAPAVHEVQHPASLHRVAILQEALNSEGAHLKVDGIWGPSTEMALRHYQRQNGLQVTGKLDQATRGSLAPIG